MKKITVWLLSVVLMMSVFIVPDYEKVYASPTLTMSVSASSVIIGDTVTTTVSVPNGYGAQVDIRFSSDLLSYSEASTSNVNVSKGQVTLNMYEALGTSTVTVKLKAVSSGTATIEAVVVKAGDENGDEVQMSGASASLTIQNKVVENPKESDDNSLASLKLSAGTLSPTFKYNVTNYTATVDYNVSSVVVSVKTSNEKATIDSVTGNGKVSLSVGENIIEVVVKAENGEKATYKIIVTRKAQEGGSQSTEEQPSETETDTEENIEGMDSGLSWNGSSLVFTEEIPTEVIPADFSKETMMFHNVEIPCLNSNKSSMTVLYLKTSDGKGALYVYNREEQNIYPFIKLTSNDRYVILLQPDELSAPEGYEMFSLSIEGKGVVTAGRPIITESDDVEDSQMMEFYLLYCMNNEGNFGWYQYDSVEKTFQRYTNSVFRGEPSHTDTESEIGEFDDEDDLDHRELNAQLKEEQDKNLKMLCIFVFVLVVLLVVIFNLILSRRKDSDEEIFDEEALDEEESDDEELDDDESDEDESDEDESKKEKSEKNKDINKEIKNEKIINDKVKQIPEEDIDDTTINDISAKLMEEAAKDAETMDDEDDDFEFIDL